jgi:hypothetical protein
MWSETSPSYRIMHPNCGCESRKPARTDLIELHPFKVLDLVFINVCWIYIVCGAFIVIIYIVCSAFNIIIFN